ncbi:MAG: amidohydrolase [Rubellimicrobium sp.]|nr:amidohydrolase [Rubellimicrobium sp.]
MPVINRIAAFADEMKEWRQHFHMNPELGTECHETAAFVAARLREFGVDEIHEGIATTGIVALIRGKAPGPVIGLRADMDALPITEQTGAPHASKIPGRMHACGHDGHTAMLLGAAKYLAETRNFEGTVALIFQPAEETGGGADVMVAEGMLDRFDIAEVYAIHTAPGIPLGEFATRPGALMAAVDTFYINIKGKGGHGAMPHLAQDPVIAACSMAMAIQTIVSRNHDPVRDLVVTVAQIHTGIVDNVIPETAYLDGTIRTFDKETQAMVMRRMQEIVAGQAASFGVEAHLEYEVGFPPTINDPDRARFASEIAGEVGVAVDPDHPRKMGAEDFSFMLEQRPGAYLFLGNGDTPYVHNPRFDFDDSAAPFGASFFARLIERRLAAV